MEEALELYLHIPFCAKKCGYCDFLSFAADDDTIGKYISALCGEIRMAGEQVLPAGCEDAGEDCGSAGQRTGGRARGTHQKRARVSTVFIGGGTPSILTAGQIEAVMEAVCGAFSVAADAEISIEVNPGTADEEKLRAFVQAGINRISIGCQSFRDDELARMSRIHDRRAIFACVDAARRAGFENLNLDLIFGIPGQDPAGWESNLLEAVSLEPEHLSAYGLIIEEGTPFYEKRTSLPLPDEDAERAMYERTAEVLGAHGYEQYELSNYAKPGRACRHNTGYWTGVPYRGLGLGAASFLYLPRGAVRFSNTRDMRVYCSHMMSPDSAALARNPDVSDARGAAEIEYLTEADLRSEYMILGLRLIRGIREEAFCRRFGAAPGEVFGTAIRKHIKNGLLAREDGRVFLTPRGRSLANLVMADFL